MGCDQCQNSLCQKTVHTSHIPVYSLNLGVCVLTCWQQVVCVVEMGVCVVEMWGMYISCKNGGMCCRNGVCVVEMWGMYISCKNGGYVL